MYDNKPELRTAVVPNDALTEGDAPFKDEITKRADVGKNLESESGLLDDAPPTSLGGLDPKSLSGLSGPKRKTLLVLVDQPGLSIKDVAETLGVTHTTAGRHLRVLCRKGLVLREKEGSMERHYAISSKEPRSLSWLRVTIQDVKRYSIVEYLVDNHRIDHTVNKIANGVSVHHGLLLRTLRQLEHHGFVDVVRPGGWYYVKVKPELVEQWNAIHESE